MITGHILAIHLFGLSLWLLLMVLAMWHHLAQTHPHRSVRSIATTYGLVCAGISLAALLTLHVTWVTPDLSQRAGALAIRVLALLIFWPAVIGFVCCLAGNSKLRFFGVATCVGTCCWFLSLAFTGALAGTVSSRHPDNYLIPNGYVGWVCVWYNVKGAPPLPIENGFLQLRIPDSGIAVTSSKLENGWATDRYNYVVGHGELKDLSMTGRDGMIWAESTSESSIGDGAVADFREQFFVGTEDQWKQSPSGVEACSALSPTGQPVGHPGNPMRP